MKRPYLSYSEYMDNTLGYRIYRVGVDAHFSCPNRAVNKSGGCVYCDALGATAAYLRKNESMYSRYCNFVPLANLSQCGGIEDIKDQIKRGKSFLERRYKAEHFALYLQSFSNTFAPVQKLKEVYDYALEGNNWDEFIISTRPDCIDREKLELIASYKNRCKVSLELGLQSGNDDILKAMNRGHSVECFEKACNLAKAFDIDVCVHILLGFPGENYTTLENTATVIRKVHPKDIKIHNLNIASQTVLFENYMSGEVTAPCAQRHIEQTVFLLRRIPDDIVIQRLICETPSHRLASPRLFPDKNTYLKRLENYMNEKGYKQGDLV